MLADVNLNGNVVFDCLNMPESLSTWNCKHFQAINGEMIYEMDHI